MRKYLWSLPLLWAAWGAVAQQHAPASPGHAMPAAKQAAPVPLGSGVAFAPDGSLWLVGLNAQGALFVQSAPAQNLRQWSAPQLLDTQGAPILADGENRPKLAFGPNGLVVVSYTQPLAKPYTGQVRLLRSTDGGRSFAPPVTVHADRQEITHRFESIGFDGQGLLHTVWIDKRDLEAAPKVDGKSSYRGAAIYRNVSRDGGASFGPDIRVADHSCECCRIGLAPDSQGRMHAMWRHVFAPDVRDHAIARLDADGSAAATVVRASWDDWRINACPHHGPALVAAAEGGFHTVWFGVRKQGAEDVAAVRYARLQADGSTLEDSVRVLPDARAEHADIQADGARVVVLWRSSEGARSTLQAWVSVDAGRSFSHQVLGHTSGANDFARLVRHGARMVAVWRTANEVQVHEIP